jgi:O-antigen biosynthesis protein
LQGSDTRTTRNGRAPSVALGVIDVLRPDQATLPDTSPAIILLYAGDVPVGRVELAQGAAVSRAAIGNALPPTVAEKALRAGMAASLAGGLPEGPLSVVDTLHALRATHPAPAALPTITVAICTRDRERQLGRALGSVAGSLGTGDELLVIDNASQQDVAPLVRRHPAARLVREERPGLDWARNRAIVESRCDIIAFCDDDCVMLDSTLPALRAAFGRNPDVDAVTGLVEPWTLDTEAQVLFDRYLSHERWYSRQWVRAPRSATVARDVGNVGRYGTGASFTVRRRLFDRIGVFDAALGAGSLCRAGDDMEFFFRLLKAGALLLREPRVSVRHDHRVELAELETQFESWSTGFACAAERSMLAYPEERGPYTTLLARIALLHHARRAIVHPWRRSIALAELRGMIGARRRYQDARRAAEQTARTIPSPAGDALPSREAAPKSRLANTGHVCNQILDLANPTAALHVATECTSVAIELTNRGRSLGTMPLDAVEGSVGADRIGDAIASQYGPVLFGTSWTDAVLQARETLTGWLRQSAA